jgi:diaphanous 1
LTGRSSRSWYVSSLSQYLNTDEEFLQDELGIKGPQRVIMRELTPDRKRFLITQHQQLSTPRSTPLRPSKTGPASTSSDYGALAGLKRFSLVGAWGGSDDNATPTKANRPLTYYDTRSSIESSPTNDSLRSDEGSVVSSPTIGQGETASGWTSWWSAASNATGTGQVVGEQSKDTPQFYVDQLRSSKISQRSLVKHLIALRVRLSTAKLSWAQAFLGAAKGLDALEALLGKITLKRVNR